MPPLTSLDHTRQMLRASKIGNNHFLDTINDVNQNHSIQTGVRVSPEIQLKQMVPFLAGAYSHDEFPRRHIEMMSLV